MAEVAVALPVTLTFHYLVPPDQDADMMPGRRVLVPFGRRQVTGYILSRSGPDQCPSVNLKEIIRPLDDGPMFGADLIPLMGFAADYYHYPLGLVMAEALPSGLKTMSRRTAFLTDAGHSALAEGGLDQPAIAVLERLAKSGGLPVSGLERSGEGSAACLKRLRNMDLIAIDDRFLTDRVSPKKQKWLRSTSSALPATGRVGPKEKYLFDLLNAEGPQSMQELRPRFPSLSAMAGRMQAKGLLEVFEKIVFRDDLGRALDFTAEPPELSAAQASAVSALTAALDQRCFFPYLLYGLTSSGKTEVYLAAARNALSRGRTVLFLVPEISMTPAVEGLLKARFPQEVAVLHSGLSDGQRYDQWIKILKGYSPLVLGARSAIFAPLTNLGLLIVDEEHDGSYKQDEKLKYQARDLAVLRAKQAGAVVILGSATPSLESYYAAQTGRYHLLTLPERIGQGRLPQVDVVDLRYGVSQRRQAVTPVLKQVLSQTLEQSHQAVLFINRRGLARLPLCLACGHVIKCLNCSVSLTLHQKGKLDAPSPGPSNESLILICHHCGLTTEPVRSCPACGSPLLRYLGFGTERLEAEIIKAFPSAKVARLDAETTRPQGELTRILNDLKNRNIDILVGTQMVTKGHDFPNITLVGVVEADTGLHLPDFRAGERTFQLLTQVSGRAGRGEAAGRVIIQTWSPEHYTLRLAEKHDYIGFFEQELEQRRQAGYPPFTRLALIRLTGNSLTVITESAEKAAGLGRAILNGWPDQTLELLGPAPAPLVKLKGKYRYQILVRGKEPRQIHHFLRGWLDRVRTGLKGSGVTLTLDVDPYHMM
ncbi:MAG: primosomal protein N' [Deltaproteobacteria bacterium]|nr:primosomal protein N' [Deltaproteobacteria bacterium]